MCEEPRTCILQVVCTQRLSIPNAMVAQRALYSRRVLHIHSCAFEMNAPDDTVNRKVWQARGRVLQLIPFYSELEIATSMARMPCLADAQTIANVLQRCNGWIHSAFFACPWLSGCTHPK